MIVANKVIGTKILIQRFENLESELMDIIQTFADNYENSTENDFIKRLFVKYGFINLTFKEKSIGN